MDNKRAFYLSSFIAIGLYCLLVFLFLFYIQNNNVKKFDAITKSTTLQLDIILETPKEKTKKIDIQSKAKSVKKSTLVKKSKSTSVKRKTNLKSLFANVKTKSARIIKQKVTNTKSNSISSRYKSKFQKVKKAKNISLNELNNKQSSSKNLIISESKNESDPYFSKIYQLISSRWKPTIYFNNLKAKVIITISNQGLFNYKFVKFSDNIGFDEQLKKFLEKQIIITYPINPNKNSTSIEITFQSKGD